MAAIETQVTASCCSTFYEQDWVRELAAECFHPGGEALTRRTVEAMQLPAQAQLVDLGCGAGTTSLLLAREYAFRVIGVDVSAANIEHANDKVRTADLQQGSVNFIQAAAGELPLPEQSCDGVLCECTLSLFPQPEAVLHDIHRVLKPGAKLAVTDMALEGDLPADMAEIIAPWTCLTGARNRNDYESLFTSNGFELDEFVDESDGLHQLLSVLKRQLLLIGAGKAFANTPDQGVDLATVKSWMDRFADEINREVIRYYRFQLVMK